MMFLGVDMDVSLWSGLLVGEEDKHLILLRFRDFGKESTSLPFMRMNLVCRYRHLEGVIGNIKRRYHENQ